MVWAFQNEAQRVLGGRLEGVWSALGAHFEAERSSAEPFTGDGGASPGKRGRGKGRGKAHQAHQAHHTPSALADSGDGQRHPFMCGVIAQKYGAAAVTRIERRISNRNIVVAGRG